MKHKIEIWQDDFGSSVKIKDKRNRVLVKASIYDKKLLLLLCSNKDDETQFVIHYIPKQETKLEWSLTIQQMG